MTARAWKPLRPPFDSFLERAKYLHMCRLIDPKARYLRPRKGHKDSFGISFDMSPTGVPTRHITVYFPMFACDAPRVQANGPDGSPHRYRPSGDLCMWHPDDPPESKWQVTDGPGALFGHIAAHLIKEEWYRRTEQWPGAEAEHGTPCIEQERTT